MAMLMNMISYASCGLICARIQGPLSTQDALDGLKSRYKNIKDNEKPNVCCRHAFFVAHAVHEIDEGTLRTLSRYINYSCPGFLTAMGVHPDNLITVFNAQTITESGVLNFKRGENGDVVHTAFLLKGSEGGLSLVHANGHMLDSSIGPEDDKVGSQVVHNLTAFKRQKLQDYIASGSPCYFTLCSQLMALNRSS